MKSQPPVARVIPLVFYVLFIFGCSGNTEHENRLSDQEEKEGWTLLFDGKTLNGWHLFNRGNIPKSGDWNRSRIVQQTES